MRASHVPGASQLQGLSALRKYPEDIRTGIATNWAGVQSDPHASSDRVMLADRVEMMKMELKQYQQKANELELKLRNNRRKSQRR
jgi:hypothetical protein